MFHDPIRTASPDQAPPEIEVRGEPYFGELGFDIESFGWRYGSKPRATETIDMEHVANHILPEYRSFVQSTKTASSITSSEHVVDSGINLASIIYTVFHLSEETQPKVAIDIAYDTDITAPLEFREWLQRMTL